MCAYRATPPLLGRDHPAAVLRAEVARAAGSHGGLVLVTGEAGIGKTTLVGDAVEEARALGALVTAGSCWDSENAPGHWPWVQIVRALRRSATAQEWERAREAAGPPLAVLLGEAHGTDGVEGFQLHDAVTSALVAVAQSRPVVAVLDDLHWADTASLKLLEFAARHTWCERLLLVGTYRDVEVESDGHPLRPLITPLLAKATTVTLTGLEPDDVRQLMARTAGEEPAAELAAEVHRRTGGNPFFVEQTARLWRSAGTVGIVAPGVRDALAHRLALLPPPVERLLTDAAVLGAQFHRQVLAAVAGAPVAQVDRLLERAVAARLVLPRGAGRFAFTHDLVRETLHGALAEDEAARRHAAVVHALDAAPAVAAKMPAAETARHARLAGDALDADRAVDLLLAAAQDAGARLAVEEAGGHLRHAYRRAAGCAPRRRVVIGLDLGTELHEGPEQEEGRRVLDEAVAAARASGDPELLARAALTLHRLGGGEERAAVTREVLAEALRALSRDSRAPGPGPAADADADRLAREVTARATVLARLGEDADALSFTLWMQHELLWGPGTAAEREALTGELAALARRSGDRATEWYAASLRWVALLEQGDPGYLDQFHRMLRTAGADTADERFQMAATVDRSVIALLMGRFAEAEELTREAEERHGHGHRYFAHMIGHLRWSQLLPQGRFDEAAAAAAETAAAGHPHAGLLAGVTAAERGDLDGALRHFVAATSGGPVPRGAAALGLRLEAQVAALSGDPERCRRARAALTPYAGEWAVSFLGCDIAGPMVLWLALVDAAEGRWDAAVGGCTAAVRSADRLGARIWSLTARVALAEALLGRDAPGDEGTAGELLRKAAEEAEETGMRHLAERARTAADRPGAAGREESGERTFRREGGVWALGYGGRTVHMPDTKGLRDLHLLLGRAGTEVPAVRMLAPGGGEEVVAARSLGGDPVLDEEARTRYKQRLAALDAEIDRAAHRGDDESAAAHDREREALLAELRRAAGLGGRSRRLGDEAERARKTVTARIRDTLRKLDVRHPELAAHLRATVSTGASCCYRPGPDGAGTTWRL
jgi:hypothetical protein